jgi:hypothetical protein
MMMLLKLKRINQEKMKQNKKQKDENEAKKLK